MIKAAIPALATVIVAVGMAGCGSNTASPGSDFCNNATAVKTSGSGDVGSDLAGAKAKFQGLANAVDSLDNSAPSDISGDTKTVRQATDKANSQAQAAGDFQGLGAALTGLNDQATTDAEKRVEAYVQSKCGISLSGSSSSGSGGSSTGSTGSGSASSGSVSDTGSGSGSASSSASTASTSS